jgi:hypothetical protein
MRRAAAAGVTWEIARALDDSEVEACLFRYLEQDLLHDFIEQDTLTRSESVARSAGRKATGTSPSAPPCRLVGARTRREEHPLTTVSDRGAGGRRNCPGQREPPVPEARPALDAAIWALPAKNSRNHPDQPRHVC